MKFDFFRLMLVLTLTAGVAACGDGESGDEDSDTADVSEDAVVDAGGDANEDTITPDAGGDVVPDVEADVETDVPDDVETDVEQDVEQDVEADVEQDVEQDAEADVEQDVEADVEDDVEQDVEVDAGEPYECLTDQTDLSLDNDDELDGATPLADAATLTGFTTEWANVDNFRSSLLPVEENPYVTVTYEGLGVITGRILNAEGGELTSISSANGTLELFYLPEGGGFGAGTYFFEISADACLEYSIEARYTEAPPEG
ncbi:MAG: hypothetical protein ACI81R_001638 [Bradymonadia bacterium]|jgi:hypothetical protein